MAYPAPRRIGTPPHGGSLYAGRSLKGRLEAHPTTIAEQGVGRSVVEQASSLLMG